MEISAFEASAALRSREALWSGRLQSVSLVAEAGFEDDEIDEVVPALTLEYRDHSRQRNWEQFFKKWPACVVAAIVTKASHVYEQSHQKMWPELMARLRVRGTSTERQHWSLGTEMAMKKLGLETFPGRGHRYVVPILLHGGVPDDCLDRYFDFVYQRRHIPADRLCLQAASEGLATLEVPSAVRRFLSQGGDFAVDFVERTQDMLVQLRSDPNGLADGMSGLPAHVEMRARSYAEKRGIDPKAAVKQGNETGSSIRLDLGRACPVLELPYAEGRTTSEFCEIEFDNRKEKRRSYPHLDGSTRFEPIPIETPCSSVNIRIGGQANPHTLPVMQQPAQMVFFGEDLSQVTGSALPKDTVWLLRDAGSEFVQEHMIRPIAEVEPALGWSGWTLQQLDLEAVESLTDAESGRSWHVSSGTKDPSVETGEPLAGITMEGCPVVFGRRPSLHLPGSGRYWTVRITELTGARRAYGKARLSGDPVEINALWDSFGSPLLGVFDIDVRGPLGVRTRRTVGLAEGLRTTYTPPWRQVGETGLETCTAQLASDTNFEFPDGDEMRFASNVVSASRRCRIGSIHMLLQVEPPHMSVTYRDDDGIESSPATLRLNTAKVLESRGYLTVSLPAQLQATELGARVGGDQVQAVRPRGQIGHPRYPIGELADTLAEHRHAVLTLTHEEREITVAVVADGPLAGGVRICDDGGLQLQGFVVVNGAMADLYSPVEPWIPPTRGRVRADGRIDVPRNVPASGRVWVGLRVVDPWIDEDSPRLPMEVFEVERPMTSCTVEALSALSRCLAGQEPWPADIDDYEPVWWSILYWGNVRPLPSWFDSALETLARRSLDALADLAECGITHDELVYALVLSGLVAIPIDQDDHFAAWLWSKRNPIAPFVGGLDHDEVWRPMLSACGQATFEALYQGRVDPNRSLEDFASTTEWLATLPRQDLDAIRRRLRPDADAGMLEQEAREMAMWELFDARTHCDLESIAPQLADWQEHAIEILRPELAEYVASRRHHRRLNDWRSLASSSAMCASLARDAVYGNASATEMFAMMRPEYAMLARHAPKLVLTDLILAEIIAFR